MELATPRQRRAFAWFCQVNNLRPELSAHPNYRFTDRSNGELKTFHLKDIADQYDEYKKMEKKIKAAERHRIAAAAKRRRA
jgi:hypothetical protein